MDYLREVALLEQSVYPTRTLKKKCLVLTGGGLEGEVGGLGGVASSSDGVPISFLSDAVQSGTLDALKGKSIHLT